MIRVGYEGGDIAKLQNPLKKISEVIATFIIRKNHQSKHFIVYIYILILTDL